VQKSAFILELPRNKTGIGKDYVEKGWGCRGRAVLKGGAGGCGAEAESGRFLCGWFLCGWVLGLGWLRSTDAYGIWLGQGLAALAGGRGKIPATETVGRDFSLALHPF